MNPWSSNNLKPAMIGAALMLWAPLIPGCDRKAQPPIKTQAPPPAIDRAYAAGASIDPPLRVRLRVDRDHMTTADRLTLDITVASADGVEVSWPEPGDTLGDFQVAGKNDLATTAAPGVRAVEHTLILEPFLDGSKRIPPLEFRYRAGPGRDWKMLTTEPITVEVASILPKDAKDVALSPAKPPVNVLFGPGWVRWAIGGSAALLALGYPAAFVAARVRARRRDGRADPISQARADLAAVKAQLGQVEKAFGHPDPAHAATLAKVGRVLLSIVLDQDVQGLLADELPLAGAPATFDRALLGSVVETLRALDQQRFAPVGMSVVELSRHTDVLQALLEQASRRRGEVAA